MFGARAAALYLIAGAIYIALGVLEPRILLSWVEGAGFLLVAVWLVPAAVALLWKR